MRVSIPKSLVAGVATIALSAAATLTSAPAGAAMLHGGGFGGFHGGFGGFHGPAMGAFRPGMSAFHPGGFGFHRGFFDRDDFFRRRFVDRDFFINRNVFVGGPGGCRGGWCGFATGAIIGAAATYPYYGYDYGCWVYRPVYRYGAYVGRRLVNICY
ncbi:MAG TPA: hypothetical protein VFE63_15530 [Roseiarcus sp.]|nr:hypothetical protein [Roseiarcus sp.]